MLWGHGEEESVQHRSNMQSPSPGQGEASPNGENTGVLRLHRKNLRAG